MWKEIEIVKIKMKVVTFLKSKNEQKMKNYGLWLSIGSLIILVASTLGYIEIAQDFETIFLGVTVVLIAAGIISNPSEGTGYSDMESKLKDKLK